MKKNFDRHRMWSQDWCAVVLAWINSLQEENTIFSRILFTSDSVFLSNLIKQIYQYENKIPPAYKNNDELADKFIKEYFPECHKEKHLDLQNEEDLYILFSLLIYTSCIKCSIQDIKTKNCRYLEANNQEVLAKFLQQMMETGDVKLNRHNIINAIQQSLGAKTVSAVNSFSPAPSTCLKEFFESPTIIDHTNKDREIKRLKALLEEEQTEKCELVDKNQILVTENKKKYLLLSEKIKENLELKNELEELSSVVAGNGRQGNNEKSLIKENSELKDELQILKNENLTLTKQVDDCTKKVKELKKICSNLENSYDSLKERETQLLEENLALISVKKENSDLKQTIKELRQVIEQYQEQYTTTNIQDISSPIDDENLGKTVIELQLIEKQDVIDQLQSEKVILKKELELEKNNYKEALQLKLQEIENLNNSCCTLRSQLSAMECFKVKNELLDAEKTNLQSKITKQEKSLKLQEQEIESLKQQIVTLDSVSKEKCDSHQRITDEHKALNLKYRILREAHDNVREEYETKLKKLKDQMKSTCTRAIQQTEEKYEIKVKQLQDVIKANELHTAQLSSQLWDTSDKLIRTKSEVVDLKKTLSFYQNQLAQRKTRSQENLSFATPEVPFSVDASCVAPRHLSIRTVPSGMGKVFPTEDEAEEMFNNECLADLKAGRCQITSEPDRLSTLKYRNSLCPPHLKSSYPAETQFLPFGSIQEDEIKGKEDDDTKSLISEKQKRKDRSQTLELRPVDTPRNALRELNDRDKKPGTPTKLFSQFFTAKHKDENTPTSSNQRRLSFFNKKFGKRDGTQKPME